MAATAEEIRQLKGDLKRARLHNEALSAELRETKTMLAECQEAIAQSQHFTRAIEHANEAFIITDCNAVIEYVNPAFTAITGYSRDEVLGQKTSLLKSDAHLPFFYENMWSTISQGDVWHGTLIEKKKDGAFYPCMMSIVPLFDEQQQVTHFVAIQDDITKERELEEQFLQAQKMEAMGTLVAGVSHDFNNILTAIQGNVFLSRRKLDDPEYVKENLDSIEQLSTAAVAMVKQLLGFARKDKMAMKSFSLNTFMKESFKLAGSAIPKGIRQSCITCREKLMIEGDATQLQQVLMNLVNNACFAVAEVAEPVITCELCYYKADEPFREKHGADIAGEFARLSVSDNGHGIPEEHLKKIFEPFYTTKGVGEGTGLGLSMVSDSVRKHGGIVEVDTSPAGTSFYLYFPLAESEAETEEWQEVEIVPGNGETILYVDSDSRSETTAEVLVNMGYKLLHAKNGVEAIKFLRNKAREIDLAIVDVVSASRESLDSVRRMRQSYADIPLILVHGFDQSEIGSLTQEIGKSIFMPKPFAFGPLSHHIRSMVSQQFN